MPHLSSHSYDVSKTNVADDVDAKYEKFAGRHGAPYSAGFYDNRCFQDAAAIPSPPPPPPPPPLDKPASGLVVLTPIEITDCDQCGWDDDGAASWTSSGASSGSRILKMTSDWVVDSLGSLSCLIGVRVASRPVTVLVACTCVALACATAMILCWKTENRMERLWIPSDSEFLRDVEWLQRNYPVDVRIEKVIVRPVAEGRLSGSSDPGTEYSTRVGPGKQKQNALNPEVILEAQRIQAALAALTIEVDGKRSSWKDLCFRVPVIGDMGLRRRRRSSNYEALDRVVRPNAQQLASPAELKPLPFLRDEAVIAKAGNGTTTSFTGPTKLVNNSQTDDSADIPVGTEKAFTVGDGQDSDTSGTTEHILERKTTPEPDLTLVPETLTPASATTLKALTTEEPDYSHLFEDPDSPLFQDRGSFDDLFMSYDDLAGLDGAGPAGEDRLIDLPREMYCPVLEDLPKECWARSILELWNYDEQKIGKLSLDGVLEAINARTSPKSEATNESKGGGQLVPSPVYGFPTDFSVFLGNPERNASGAIVFADALMLEWMLQAPSDGIRRNKSDTEHDSVFEAGATKEIMAWEKAFIELLSRWNTSSPDVHVEVLFSSGRSFVDLAMQAIMGDVFKLAAGYTLLFAYATLVLSKRNWIENKVLVSFASLVSIVMSILTSFGICLFLGVVYGPMHNMLPLLLLGIGIDDMFVLAEAYENVELELKRKRKQKEGLMTATSGCEAGCKGEVASEPLPRVREVMGMAMREAGTAITVTSLTDLAAFAIGAPTTLPALGSFCVYAAVGVVCLYVFQMTFFAAAFTLDVRRVRERRNGIIPCIVNRRSSASTSTLEGKAEMSPLRKTVTEWNQRNIGKEFMARILGPALTHPTVKLVVLVVGFAVLGVNSYGVANLRREFDPIWFLPQESHLFKFSAGERVLFPHVIDTVNVGSSNGKSSLFLGPEVRYHEVEDMRAISLMLREMREDPVAGVRRLESWTEAFANWTSSNFNIDLLAENNTARLNNSNPVDEMDLMSKLSLFLYSPDGYKYMRNVKTVGNFTCYGAGKDARIVVSTIDFAQPSIFGAGNQIAAMRALKEIVSKYFPTSSSLSWPDDASPNAVVEGNDIRVRAFSPAYAGWETNEIIEVELRRNVLLALACIFVMTLVLIASLRTSLLVTACVFMTVVDIGGLMYFWNLTVDTVSCIAVVIGIGLSVDYSAHIGHSFMNQQGPSRDDRVCAALRSIGTAVFHGGFSTLLAFLVLADSDSHVFGTFFKVFVGIVGYGLFHGLIFLPVVLSLVGPPPHEAPAKESEEIGYQSTKVAAGIPNHSSSKTHFGENLATALGHHEYPDGNKQAEVVMWNHKVSSASLVLTTESNPLSKESAIETADGDAKRPAISTDCKDHPIPVVPIPQAATEVEPTGSVYLSDSGRSSFSEDSSSGSVNEMSLRSITDGSNIASGRGSREERTSTSKTDVRSP